MTMRQLQDRARTMPKEMILLVFAKFLLKVWWLEIAFTRKFQSVYQARWRALVNLNLNFLSWTLKKTRHNLLTELQTS